MSNATFHNFSLEAFTGFWNGKPKTFAAGEKKYMPAYLAEHFAKHLTNRELIRDGKEVYTSPKNPLQVKQFMDLFNKAFIPDEPTEEMSELDDEINAVQKKGPSMNIEVKKSAPITGPGTQPQVVTPPADDEEEDENSEFEVGAKK